MGFGCGVRIKANGSTEHEICELKDGSEDGDRH